MNLKASAIFDQAHPKIFELIFSFPELAPAGKKSVYSICSVFEIQLILEYRDQTVHTHFFSMPTK